MATVIVSKAAALLRALVCLAAILPGIIVPKRFFNNYIRLVDFTGLVWLTGIQPYNYPYYTLVMRPLYLLMPSDARCWLKAYAKRSYSRRRYYRDM
jgi:hypothetical protein